MICVMTYAPSCLCLHFPTLPSSHPAYRWDMFGRRLHYGAQLEASTYQHNTADYLYMYIVGMAAMDVRNLLAWSSVTHDALHLPWLFIMCLVNNLS